VKLSVLRAGRPLVPEIFLVLISVRDSIDYRAIERLEISSKLKNKFEYLIGNQTRDFHIASITTACRHLHLYWRLQWTDCVLWLQEYFWRTNPIVTSPLQCSINTIFNLLKHKFTLLTQPFLPRSFTSPGSASHKLRPFFASLLFTHSLTPFPPSSLMCLFYVYSPFGSVFRSSVMFRHTTCPLCKFVASYQFRVMSTEYGTRLIHLDEILSFH
jgi:hypothetical protein